MVLLGSAGRVKQDTARSGPFGSAGTVEFGGEWLGAVRYGIVLCGKAGSVWSGAYKAWYVLVRYVKAGK